MRKHGGFEHNRQSLRVVDFLEQKYPRFPGLNLTWEVREGMAKHGTRFDAPGTKQRPKFHSPSLEAQVANLADEITYYSHDLDDGLTANLFTEKQLNRDVKVWREAAKAVRREYGPLPDECRRYFIIRCIIDCQVKDVVYTTEERIAAAGITTVDDARAEKSPLVQYSAERRKLNVELRRYLYKNMYFAEEVYVPNRRAVRMLEDLFHYYSKNRKDLAGLIGNRAKTDGWPRAICDYLAGMTDRFAIQEHQRIFGLRV
jgi:dGTPase